ncbi:hypothetical protein M378DRAFT_179245 [Amanita muscaria Koide BX008]|uniref:Autophagy-related protein 4 n=1 Tax=Amanita muscaria (strain Koide BX008) TaxID=946122 RepID=A0A0C2T9P7_AMAMK|nr:hypothetical protein M378DRAFT_179245 [Amanita muscaria Koide BX008]
MSSKSSKHPPSPSSSKLSKIFQRPSTRDRAKSASDQPTSNLAPPIINEPPEQDIPPAMPRPARPSSPRTRTRSERPITTASELMLSRSLHSSPSASKLSDLPTRISGWFNHTFSSSTNDLSLPNLLSQPHSTGSPSSPRVKLPSSFLTAIPSKAVRYIFDTDATADKCSDPIWLLGIQHPGYEPPPQPPREPIPPPQPQPQPSSSAPATISPTSASAKQNPNQGNSGSPRSIQSATLSLSESSSNSSLADIPEYIQPLGSNKSGWPPAFYADFTSRVWLTYRSSFPPIKDGRLADLGCGSSSVSVAASAEACSDTASVQGIEASPSVSKRTWPWSSTAEKGWTSDTGWGCMLRTGQSLLANALIHFHLGRDWRRPPYPIYTVDYATYVQIMTWFFDSPAPEAPFSVHRMALAGKELGKDVGQWFGPSTAAGAIKTLVLGFPECGLGVAVATDSALYQSDVYTASHGGPAHARSPRKIVKTTWGDRPVLLLLGVRLGIDRVNPIYYDTIKQLYTFPQSVGIAGGRPSSSYYFVGAQANNLFYLDPHTARHTIPLRLPPSLSPPESTGSTDSDREQTSVKRSSSKLGRSPSQQRQHRQKSSTHSNHARIPTSPSSIRTSSSTFSYHAPMSPSPLQQQYSTSSTNSTTSTDASYLSSSPGTGGGGGAHLSSSPRHKQSKSPPVSHARFHSQIESRRRWSEVEQGSSIGHASASETNAGGGGSSIASSLIGGLDPLQQHYAMAYSFAELKTFHCDQVRKMPMSGLDPSMLIGFLCRDEADWIDLRKRVGELPKTIFSIQDEPPKWPDEFDDDMGVLESVSSEAGGDGDSEGLEEGEERGRAEEEDDEGDDVVKVEVEGDAGSDEFFDTRSRSSAEGSPPDKGVVVIGSGGVRTSTRSSTEEDPVDPVTPGPGSFSLPGEKPLGIDDDDDDWVDSSLVIQGQGTGLAQSPVLVERPSGVPFSTTGTRPGDETRNGGPPAPERMKKSKSGKSGKSSKKKKPAGNISAPPMASSSSRSQSSSYRSPSTKGKSKSLHRRGDLPSEADDERQERGGRHREQQEHEQQEHYLFPGAGTDDDEFLDGPEDVRTPMDPRSRNNTATATGGRARGEDAQMSGRRMNNVRARDGGRTQSGGVKGVLTAEG